jgi:hypothetical protein
MPDYRLADCQRQLPGATQKLAPILDCFLCMKSSVLRTAARPSVKRSGNACVVRQRTELPWRSVQDRQKVVPFFHKVAMTTVALSKQQLWLARI